MFKLLPIFVHVDKDSTLTIISLKGVDGITGVIMNISTLKEKAIIVQLNSGKIYTFKKCDEGIYEFDTE